MTDLTHERLLSLLAYDADRGTLTWLPDARDRSGRLHPKRGQSAGWVENSGYPRLTIDGRTYLAHRVAWFHVHGVWPGELDHRNTDPLDYRLANLREVTHQQNTHNITRAHRDSASGLLGVRARKDRWVASICVAGERTHLGTFDTAEEAHAAYVAAKRERHPAWAG